jgi:hypothetical protein
LGGTAAGGRQTCHSNSRHANSRQTAKDSKSTQETQHKLVNQDLAADPQGAPTGAPLDASEDDTNNIQYDIVHSWQSPAGHVIHKYFWPPSKSIWDGLPQGLLHHVLQDSLVSGSGQAIHPHPRLPERFIQLSSQVILAISNSAIGFVALSQEEGTDGSIHSLLAGSDALSDTLAATASPEVA